MNLRRTLLSVTTTLALLSACSLRPYYRDVVVPEGSALTKPAEGQTVMLRVVDPDSGQPLPGVRVLCSGSRARLVATSDAQGLLTVAVSRSLLEENPLVEVVLPKGVKHYRIEPVSAPGNTVGQPYTQPATSGEAAPATPPATPPAAPSEAPAMAADAGTGTDAGM